MSQGNLILEKDYTPSFGEISGFIKGPAQELWTDLISFIETKYKALPKITYSCCSAKPGWNVKYQKSGKSLCTLYPEEAGFVALVVVSLDLVPVIEAVGQEFEPALIELVRNSKPFNGTLWLMISVENKAMQENVKQLLLLKQVPKKPK